MTDRPLRALVVDDEGPARTFLRDALEGLEGVEWVAECANGLEAVRAILAERPDVVFLDVRMPKIDGFEVLELLEAPDDARGRPAIVFVTACDDRAIEAFEVDAVDYLLKPVADDRLAEAVERVRQRRRKGEAAPVLRRESSPTPLDRVLVRDGGAIHVVRPSDIDWIEARDDAVSIRRRDGSELRKQVGLGELARRLDPGRFVRVHRSYLLNVERLAGLELYAKDSRVALLPDGSRIPVSRAGYARLRELL